MSDDLKEMLIRHEGKRAKPYKCSEGKLTIGVGRNLDDVGLSDFEIDFLLDNDISRVTNEAIDNLDWFLDLDEPRKDVVLSMLFNLGLPRFLGFRRMIAALKVDDFATAADEMLDSKWAEQVGGRAHELSEMMRLGHYLKKNKEGNS